MSVLAIMLLIGNASAARGQDSLLQLLEISSWTVPDSFPLSGLAASRSGKIVLWSRTSSYLIVLSEDLEPIHQLELPVGVQPSFSALAGDSAIELVTQVPAEVHRLSLAGVRRGTVSIGADASLIAAARASNGWVFLLERSDGEIVLTAAAGEVQIRPGRELGSGDDVEEGYGSVTTHGEAIILTEIRAPYTVRIYEGTTRQRLTLNPPTALIDSLGTADGQPDLDTWVALPALPLGRGYIQTIADMASDRRVLVLYDNTGQVIRTQVLDVSIGFAASIPEERVLIAARRINRVEIVKYRWRWSDTRTNH